VNREPAKKAAATAKVMRIFKGKVLSRLQINKANTTHSKILHSQLNHYPKKDLDERRGSKCTMSFVVQLFNEAAPQHLKIAYCETRSVGSRKDHSWIFAQYLEPGGDVCGVVFARLMRYMEVGA
jgi:hypothetical protein